MDKGFRFGRRKSDWLLPGILVAICTVAVGWGLFNQTRRHDEEVMSKMTKAQVRLMHHLLEHQHRNAGKLAETHLPR